MIATDLTKYTLSFWYLEKYFTLVSTPGKHNLKIFWDLYITSDSISQSIIYLCSIIWVIRHDIALIQFVFLNFLKDNCIYLFWLCWVYTASLTFLVVTSGGYSVVVEVGFSLQWLILLQSMSSAVCGLSSCGSQA